MSFELARGEVLGLVGESGSGKSVTGFSILGLVDPPGRIAAGSIVLRRPRTRRRRSPKRCGALRGKRIAMIFQDPMMTLNPVLSIETQMVETVLAHEQRRTRRRGSAPSRRSAASASPRPPSACRSIRTSSPAACASASRSRSRLLHRPDLIIADEPTTALDVDDPGQILYEMQKLVRESGTALIWITHDLAVVAGLADRIAVMYAGRIVETGDAGRRARRATSSVHARPARLGAGRHPSRANGCARSAERHRRCCASAPGCAFRDRCDRALRRVCGDAAARICRRPGDSLHTAAGAA